MVWTGLIPEKRMTDRQGSPYISPGSYIQYKFTMSAVKTRRMRVIASLETKEVHSNREGERIHNVGFKGIPLTDTTASAPPS